MFVKQFIVGAIEAALFCSAVFMLALVVRPAFADGPGGGSMCVPEDDPGPCSYDCCNRCILYEDYPYPPGFLCGGHCNWNTDPCDGCEAGCDQVIIVHDRDGETCPCGLL
jgi:hypothetical protein